MPRLERTSVLLVAAFFVAGIAAGVLVQVFRSATGAPPVVPPLTLAATLVVIAGVLLALGLSLRRAVTRKSERPVNPFHAVRLLAGARASQFAGSLLGGFGFGLLLQVLTRTVIPPAATWLPMLMVGIAGAVLLGAGALTEWWCRVPPTAGDQEPDTDSEVSAGEQPV